MTDLVVYVDGSGTVVGGCGGCGFVAIYPDGRELEGNLPLERATNQQAEILAAAYALHTLEPHPSVLLRSDSQYVVQGWGWLAGWIERGWRTKRGPVANRSHWERLQAAAARHGTVRFEWLKGHAGNAGNERADALAREARAAARLPA